MTAGLQGEGKMASLGAQLQAQTKLGRFAQPHEIASVVSFLAGADASYVSGVALPVDGGFTAGNSYGVVDPRSDLATHGS